MVGLVAGPSRPPPPGRPSAGTGEREARGHRRLEGPSPPASRPATPLEKICRNRLSPQEGREARGHWLLHATLEASRLCCPAGDRPQNLAPKV